MMLVIVVTITGQYTSGSSGLGTYSVGYSGSDIQLSWHPDSNNAGVGTTAVINTITIGIGNSDYSGVGTFTMKHSKFNTKSTTIAAASVGTTSVIGEYITQTDSATDGYDAGYFIVQLTDTTNGSYGMSEMLVMDDYLLAEEVIEECASFPFGEHDDYVDSMTQAVLRFRQGNFISLHSDEVEEEVYRKKISYY